MTRHGVKSGSALDREIAVVGGKNLSDQKTSVDRRGLFSSRFARLPPSIWGIFFIQIIVRGGDFVFPFLTLYLTQKQGLSSHEAGLWLMTTNAIGLCGMLIAGILSDLGRRKAILVACMAGTAGLVGTCGFLPLTMVIPRVLLIAVFFQGSMKPLLAATVMDHCPAPLRKEGFSLSYLGTNIGVAVGPSVAAFLYAAHTRWLFWGSGLAVSLALLLLGLLIPGTANPEKENQDALEETHRGNLLGVLLDRPVLMALYPLTFLLSFAYSQTGFGLALYSADLFGDGGARVFGSLMSFNAIVVLASTALWTKFSRDWAPLTAMAVGTALYTVGFGMLTTRLDWGLLALSTFIWTQGEVLLATNTGPFLAKHSPKNFRGRLQSLREIMVGGGSIVSPLICGSIASDHGINAAWIVAASVAFCCCIGFAVLRNRS